MNDEYEFPVTSTTSWAVLVRLEVEKLKAALTKYQLSPARHQIWSAYIRCLESWIVFFLDGPESGADEKRLLKEFRELRPYIYESAEQRRPPGSPSLARNALATDLVRNGMDFNTVSEVLDKGASAPSGRPFVKKQMYLKAYELHHYDRKTIPDVMRMMCPCGNVHTDSCLNHFKEGIKTVARLLKKYGARNSPPIQ
jgi:hypothetical protein